ncbi:MAG: TldD/PmbA family protein [Christensenellales bacterium]
MINKSTIQAVLGAALSTGADFAELFVEDTRRGHMLLQSGKVEEAVSGREHGAGVRIFLDKRSIYAYTNDTSEAGLIETARKAAAAIGSFKADMDVVLHPSKVENIHKVLIPSQTVPYARKAQMLKDAYAAAKGYSPLISQAEAQILEREQRVLIANSEGLMKEDERNYVRFFVRAIASEKGENQIGHESPGAQKGYEFFEGLDLKNLGNTAAEIAVTMLKAPVCPAGIMPVAIENGFGGVIFHEACGHSLEATSVAKGASQFSGKLGQMIASPIVSAVDDGTMPGEWGSINIDDEGSPTQRNLLIKDGVLNSYMIDKIGGRRMGMASTGSGRRQDYKFAPTSRMTNTFICPGNDDDAEIISSMGDGLYARRMGGGSVNPSTGDFNFAVLEGYLVKGGKIDSPVRGASLIGKGDEVLIKIDRVGKNIAMGQGMCGSLSGSVPTNVGQPLIRISSLTVGGR